MMAAGSRTSWGFPVCRVYGSSREQALASVKALALQVIADRLEHGEDVPEIETSS